MKIWTDRNGNKLTPKEFAERFKSGVEKITPLQNTKITLWGFGIVEMGLILGIIFNIIASIWWLVIVLCGSLLITTMSILGTYQKYLIQKKMADIMNGINIDDINDKIEKEVE